MPRHEVNLVSDGIAAPLHVAPRRRILLVSVTPFFGGGEVYLLKLARLLHRHHDVKMLGWQQGLLAAAEMSGIAVHAIPHSGRSVASRYYIAASTLRQICRQWRPDVIHLNGQGESHLSAIAKICDIPVVTTRHTPFAPPMVSRAMQRLVLAEYSAIEAVICISTMLLQQLARRMNREKLHLIPNWIDFEIPPAGQPRPRKSGSFRLLVVSRLEPAKGVMDVVDAIRGLDNVVLEIAGDGPQRVDLEAAANGLPVRFLGHQIHTAPLYQAADLVVFPSTIEGQGLVPLEAMAHGTPCVASDIEPVLETVDGGRCAAIYRHGNVQDLAHQISLLGRDPGRLERLRAAGLERVRHHYTESAVEPGILKIFQEVVRNRRSSNERRSS